MSDKSDTPRTDAELRASAPYDSSAFGEIVELARQLERALASVTRERDELAREMKRHFPISRFNGLDIGQWKDRAEQAEARVKELEDRLEISHAYDADGNKVPFPKGAPDGIACRDMTIRLLEERAEEAETELLGVKEYREKNPLGGPAKVFDAMADSIRAGDDFMAVLRDYGFYTADEMKAAERDALRLRDALCPRRWTREQNEAWHKNIPDVHLAFEELLRVTDAAMEAGRE